MTDQVYLGFTHAELEQKNAVWTAKEISQQPMLWQVLSEIFAQRRTQLDSWLAPILAEPALRIIMTGAGTSAYIGEALQPHLQKYMPLSPGQRVEAVSTTDILSNPDMYLQSDVPTLLVSYGRSGNSPESKAAVQLTNQLVDKCWHLVVSCNAQGALAKACEGNDRYQLMLMPDEAHDQSFAMTSSFTCMMLSTLMLFAPDQHQFERMLALSSGILREDVSAISQLAELATERLVFLGAGPLQAIAREAALKVLELTAGQLPSFYETPLGFRHGPKSLINSATQVVLLPSANPYTSRYDTDLRLELEKDAQALDIGIPLPLSEIQQLEDAWLGFPYILYCQILGFFKALKYGISPDNPCPTGEVNRVVQGVTLYPFTRD
ncbi:SIS domain-containing protein [Bowmanella yangjiangensis]|uniref:SIS domain-containing protein n=1 Tax=Bowmanella yangjiangensis TaxID=2811230 RepID=A0ABS3CUB4_9ALTE|nr:SIS domain-containing protein [Bowmanella yangjiangensis]MBN7820707.1 SIS domain-containing protein [Bowmanella yangjiangensis]